MLTYIEPLLIEQYQSRVDQNGYNVTRGGEHIPVGNRGGSKKDVLCPTKHDAE